MMNEHPDIAELQLEAWKTVVDVQQHFNDIEMRIRALLLTLIGILLTVAAGFAGHAPLATAQAPLSAVTSYTMTVAFALSGIFALLFWYMDRGWYHVYLRGAVDSGTQLERSISSKVEGIDLTQSISRRSHEKQLGRRRTTGNRLVLFYGSIVYLSAAGAILTRFFNQPCIWGAIGLLAVILLSLWIFGPDTATAPSA